ncbi:MAG: formate dehydrogenase subunit alpha [Gammaproteobacteria bacterium]|nr:formate dehydrogenase subunit alpha [Gammaproteobacteria bacterium]
MLENNALIDGHPYHFNTGETIYTFVSRHLGSETIPVLCHDPALEPFGSCRLCSVEISSSEDGARRVVAACHTPVTAGQHIWHASERIERLRGNIVELLLSDYPDEKLQPLPGEKPTPFQRLLQHYGLNKVRFPKGSSSKSVDQDHPYIRFDATECINCYRCIRSCDEVQGEFVLSMYGRGYASRIIRSLDQSFKDSECVSCGRCVQTCPTNALSDHYRAKTIEADKTVRTVCTYCGVGCNLEVLVTNGEVQAIQAPEDAAVNAGHTCVKGRYAFSYYNHPERLRQPLIRRNGKLQPASWDEALDYITAHLQQIGANHGPDAIAGISSARCTNEENYLMQKFMRLVVGTNNIDGCARVCHAPTAYGMQQTYGTGAATNSIDEIELADCLLVIGANPGAAHPVTGSKLRQRALKGVPMIVIDPRVTDLARIATIHLQLRPGSNVAMLNMLLYYILQEGLQDDTFIAERTEGFAEFRQQILEADLDHLESITGVERAQVHQAARIYAEAEQAMEFHGLGVTEHFQGSKAVMLIAALAMLTGNIGRPGVGINPLRGQNNVQGAADMGVQPNLGAGYLDYTRDDIKAHYLETYGQAVPERVGYKIPEMFQAARAGRLKAMWVVGEDMLQTDPNSCEVKRSLKQLDLLVVQELFMTETAAMADVVLPASSHFEKSGTFTNGERRIQRVNQVVKPLEGTRPDGQIIVDVMNHMGFKQPGYDPALHLQEISQVVPFFAGVTWDNLGDNGKQWPVLADGSDTQILHRESFNLGLGRFRFFTFEESPELEPKPEPYPYILTTGRILEHYNCGSMTRRTPNRELVAQDWLLINPADASAHNIADGDLVEISSRQGTTHVRAQLSDEVKPGVLFTTFHYPEIAINHITSGVMDEFSMTPEYKVVAVAIRKDH